MKVYSKTESVSYSMYFFRFILMLIFLPCILGSFLYGNEFVVKSIEKIKTDNIPRNLFKKDLNGDPCAMIQVTTDIDVRISFDSNLGLPVSPIREGPGTYRVLVSKNERNLELSAEEFIPKSISLNQIGNVNSYDVIALKITSLEKDIGDIPVTILSYPSNAEKWIDGKKMGTENYFKIPEGSHLLEVKKNGYDSYRQEVNISADNCLFTGIRLNEKKLTEYIVNTSPDGARFYIDGNFVSVTNDGRFIYPGRYKLRIEKEKYLTLEKEIEIFENSNNVFSYHLEKNVCHLQIDVIPQHADIYLNGKKHDMGNHELAPGTYKIYAAADGYITSDPLTIELKKGDTKKRQIHLVKNAGILQLDIIQDDVKVSLNNREYATQKYIELTPGTYKLKLSKDRYYPVEDIVDIQMDNTTVYKHDMIQITGDLQAKVKPITTRCVLKRGSRIIAEWDGLIYLDNVPIGNYIMECRFSKRNIQKEPVMINKNETTVKNISEAYFSEKNHITKTEKFAGETKGNSALSSFYKSPKPGSHSNYSLSIGANAGPVYQYDVYSIGATGDLYFSIFDFKKNRGQGLSVGTSYLTQRILSYNSYRGHYWRYINYFTFDIGVDYTFKHFIPLWNTRYAPCLSIGMSVQLGNNDDPDLFFLPKIALMPLNNNIYFSMKAGYNKNYSERNHFVSLCVGYLFSIL